MVPVDVVVVAFNSAQRLEQCIGGFRTAPELTVVVVDNKSTDDSVAIAQRLADDVVASPTNRGFAHGCNVGWRRGASPYVLLLNPDAAMSLESLELMVDVMESDARIGIAGPRILNSDGQIEFSQRRFPRPRSTFARAFFAYRFFPRAAWADEVIRDVSCYQEAGSPDWISGACMLVRRSVLEELDGLDERFFMYCEDVDLCRRARTSGYDVRFVPDATASHEGGASAPRAELIPVLAASSLAYARKHQRPSGVWAERVGLVLEASVRAMVTRRGRASRQGQLRALKLLTFGPVAPDRPESRP